MIQQQSLQNCAYRVAALAVSAGILTSYEGVLAQLSVPTPTRSPIVTPSEKDRQAKAKFWIKAINREQQIWALEKNQFASQINNLALVAELPKSEHYRYGITEIDPQRLVQNIAVAQRDRLKSYVGLVYLQRRLSGTTLIELVCESNQPTQQPPGKPTIEGEVIQCPIGYSPVGTPVKMTREFNEGFSVRD